VAEVFAQSFEEKYLSFQQQQGVSGEDLDRIPTIEDKTTLSYNLFKLPPVVVGDILSYLHNECPICIDNSSPAQIQLSVDAIPPRFFWEVYKRIFEEMAK